jgi:hypothetical protein
MSRDLPAALSTFKEALTVARRAGVSGMLDWSYGNYACVLWNAGQIAESRTVLDEAKDVVHVPTIMALLRWVEACLAEATGEPMPPPLVMEGLGQSWDLAALGCLEVLTRTTSGNADGAAALTKETLEHTLAAAGLDDDFMNFWPPLVRAAVAAGETGLADELLEPVVHAAPGLVSPAVAAHLLNLQGVVGALRGDDAAVVEENLRAGVTALADFGAVGWSAKADEDLGRWLVSQGRASEGASTLANARQVYEDIGATGWVTQLDTWRSASAVVAETAG